MIYKRALALTLVISFLLFTTFPIKVEGIEKTYILEEKSSIDLPKTQKSEILTKFQSLSKGNLKFYEDDKDGHSFFITGKLSEKKSPTADEAVKFIEENKSVLGLNNNKNNFTSKETFKDDLGYTHVKVNQLLNGLEVVGKQAIVHYDKDGIIASVNGNIENSIVEITKLGNKALSNDEALEIAKKEYGFKSFREEPKAEKKILIKDGKAFEVFEIHIVIGIPTIVNDMVYVEAASGKILDKISQIRYMENPTNGSGKSGDGTTKSLSITTENGVYYLHDITAENGVLRDIYTCNYKGTTEDGFVVGETVSNSTNNFTSPFYIIDRHEQFIPAVDAHNYTGRVYHFYSKFLGRDSLDGRGGAICSYVHAPDPDSSTGSLDYSNAQWDGYEVVYGDGDGKQYTYYTNDLDTVGHEMTHGLIEKTAALSHYGSIYEHEPAIIDEGIADIFGILIETYNHYVVENSEGWLFNDNDWKIGDQIIKGSVSGASIRNLAYPHNTYNPENMSEYQPNDKDFQHKNATIIGHAGYELAKAIGCGKTAKIYYRALTAYMTPGTNFIELRRCLIQAAADIYGLNSVEVSAVINANNHVGIIEFQDPFEPNDSLFSAGTISPNQDYEAFINNSADCDYYRISVKNPSRLMINLTNIPYMDTFDIDLIYYNGKTPNVKVSDHTFLGSTHIDIDVGAGDYYVRISPRNGSYDRVNKYRLNYSSVESKDSYEPNDCLYEYYRIISGRTYKACISGLYDTDNYKVVVGENGVLEAVLKNVTFTTTLTLSDTFGNNLSSDYALGTRNAEIRYNVTPGTYYLNVAGSMDTNNQYELTCIFPEAGLANDTNEPNDNINQAVNINSNITYYSNISYVDDSDCYKVTVTKPGRLIAKADGLSTLDYRMFLASDTGTYLAATFPTNELDPILIDYFVMPGTYYIEIQPYITTAFTAPLPYTIKVSIPLSEDVNSDGNIDITDIAAVAKRYKLNKTSNLWNGTFDLNKDGIIDIYDLVIVSRKISS